MQQKITSYHPRGFSPFILEIKVETKEELFELWHRINLSNDEVKRLSDKKSLPFWDHGRTWDLWQLLDRLCIEMGFRKDD